MGREIDIAKMSKETCISALAIQRALKKHPPQTVFDYMVMAFEKAPSPIFSRKVIYQYYFLLKLKKKKPNKKEFGMVEEFFETIFKDIDPYKAARLWKKIHPRFHPGMLETLIAFIYADRNKFVRKHAYRFFRK